MDFGVGFLSNNVMLPILDFFYGIVSSYGLAIIFLTLVIRFALYPLNAGSIRNMRKMKVAQPLMQKKMKEAQEKYADDPMKMREAQSELYKEFGNPLGGCFPLLLQMPILFALFATLKGSPFADVPFDINLHVVPTEVAAEIEPVSTSSSAKNVFFNDSLHKQLLLTAPASQLAEGSTTQLALQGTQGQSFASLRSEFAQPGDLDLTPSWIVTKGEEVARVKPDGTVVALQSGDVTVQAKVPGVAADTGFLFIEKLGRVGAFGDDGSVHWDIIGMVIVFGLSTYISQSLNSSGANAKQDDNQQSINKITPVLFSGMFLFFPLPAGVLIYIVVSNIFQTAQTYFLSREPLPENIQKLVEQERKVQEIEDRKSSKTKGGDRESLPFER